MKIIVGIDEVGRGPLAGPVTVCAFYILKSRDKIEALFNNIYGQFDLRDSKKLTAKRRELISRQLHEYQTLGICDFKYIHKHASIIDEIGISKSIDNSIFSLLQSINVDFDVKLDGALPSKYGEVIIKGDEKVLEIACASIIAKVIRDNLMLEYSRLDKYHIYGFDKHAGYATAYHRNQIIKNGPSDIHRMSYLGNILKGINQVV